MNNWKEISILLTEKNILQTKKIITLQIIKIKAINKSWLKNFKQIYNYWKKVIIKSLTLQAKFTKRKVIYS